MQLDELHPDLRREYKEGLPSGVEKFDHQKSAGMWFVVPPPPPKDLPTRLPESLLAGAESAIASQPAIDQATDLDRLISYLFIRKEAVESSRIEGTMSTLDHVLTPGNLLDQYRAKSEGASVRGYAHALEEELKQIPQKGLSIFSLELISRLHRATMALDPKFRGIPGKLRSEPLDLVCISGPTQRPQDSIYNPAPPLRVRGCLEAVMDWFSDAQFIKKSQAGVGMPLTVRMAIGHSHFEAIHPFSDGNGRVGRMLMTLQMACHGKVPIYLSGYIEEHKQEYYQTLQQAQKRLNYAPLTEYVAYAIIASSIESQRTRERLETLPSEWLERGAFRKNSTAEKSLRWLIANPIFTVKELELNLKVSAQAANTAADLLQKKGVVRERTGFERNRVFAAEEVISLLSRRFGADPREALEGARHMMKAST
jgi:Fic family protein